MFLPQRPYLSTCAYTYTNQDFQYAYFKSLHKIKQLFLLFVQTFWFSPYGSVCCFHFLLCRYISRVELFAKTQITTFVLSIFWSISGEKKMEIINQTDCFELITRACNDSLSWLQYYDWFPVLLSPANFPCEHYFFIEYFSLSSTHLISNHLVESFCIRTFVCY